MKHLLTDTNSVAKTLKDIIILLNIKYIICVSNKNKKCSFFYLLTKFWYNFLWIKFPTPSLFNSNFCSYEYWFLHISLSVLLCLSFWLISVVNQLKLNNTKQLNIIEIRILKFITFKIENLIIHISCVVINIYITLKIFFYIQFIFLVLYVRTLHNILFKINIWQYFKYLLN